MSDEPEDEDLGEIEVDASEAPTEWWEVEDGYIILPRGAADTADHFGSPALKIRMSKGGALFALVMEGQKWAWRDVTAIADAAKLIMLRPK